jgi:hypothetical protein
MSLHFHIDLTNETSPALAALRKGLADHKGNHEAMGFGVAAAVQAHLHANYVGRPNALGGKSTGFWKSAAESVAAEHTESDATVSIRHRGVALRYYGGIVKPTTRKALSVPVHKSAHGLNASEYPEKLAFIPASRAFGPVRKGGVQDAHFVGFLVRGESRTVTRGKNKGKTRVLPVKNAETIYILRKQTTHKPDPNILPSDGALIAAAKTALLDYLESFDD